MFWLCHWAKLSLGKVFIGCICAIDDKISPLSKNIIKEILLFVTNYSVNSTHALSVMESPVWEL